LEDKIKGLHSRIK
jgi:hypothetical protein